MLFPHRPTMLLLLALLGTAGMAVAGPQDSREPTGERAPNLLQGQGLGDQARPQRPLRVIDGTERRERRERQRRQEDTLPDSVRRIERRTRGQVLSAERVPYEGRDLNRIKVIDENGRVRVFMDDPAQRPPTRGDDD